MIIPQRLKTGDTVAIVSTARSIDSDKLNFATTLIESWGLKVLHGPNLSMVSNQFAGTDQQRADDLQWAIDHPMVKAIICFRGGYGTVRILDLVDFEPFKASPKWICGYSDVTVLHQKLATLCIASLHSTMPINFSENTHEATDSLRSALIETPIELSAKPHELNRFGSVTAPVVGGNLSIIYSLGSTDIDLYTDGKILLLEDLDEYLYHIDRMMQNLYRSGKLSKLKGLIIGGMTDMNDNTIPFGKAPEEIIAEAVSRYKFPVAFNFPVGHINNNQTIELNGCLYELKVTSNLSGLKPIK